jgi:hypothetical protein
MAIIRAVRVGIGKPDRRYEVEDAMRTLTRAEEIKRNPTLMKDVRALASDMKRIVGRESSKKGK